MRNPWSQAEDAALRQMWLGLWQLDTESERSAATMSVFGRGWPAARARADHLGLKPPERQPNAKALAEFLRNTKHGRTIL
jgi:hypothetical protein